MRALPLTLLLITVSLTAGMYLGPVSPTHSMSQGKLLATSSAQAPSLWNFTIYVGATGFNSTHKAGFTLSVNQGDLVTIWFIYNDTGSNNPHDIQIQAYGLSTGTLDQSNRVKSLTFTANIPGITSIVCTNINCKGHANLLAGVLDVKPSTGAEWIRTTIHLTGGVQSHSRPVVVLSAHMIDVNGSVVSDALLRFYRNSTWGFAEIGVAATNSSGLADLTYSPPSDGDVVFKTLFMGGGAYLPSSSDAVTVYYSSPGGSQPSFPYVWGQNSIIDLRIVGVPGLAGLFWIGVALAVLASVWGTYTFVLRQIAGIWKDGLKTSQASKETSASIISLDTALIAGRNFSIPGSLLVGLAMMGMGYSDSLLLTLLAPSLSLLALPVLSLVEALAISRLLTLRKN